jgi:hypothetical protein
MQIVTHHSHKSNGNLEGYRELKTAAKTGLAVQDKELQVVLPFSVIQMMI